MTRSRALMKLGQDLFFEKALSGSGKMSCASCHDPDHGFTPANDLAVQLGGEKLDRPGTRAVPERADDLRAVAGFGAAA